ncbi:hypothetical protein C5E16_08370 [Clavibacter michiganensis]|uniref:Uncharacterized protein n=1 Tax=Clavibacter michiganensis TaxID=28447 RepID=A0A2S5VUJ0_9MICO|nr:polysaccharide biosynthesis C-terminal domain-containing protein [Clavibacter michiganensis]PPF67800.1 hypothetical protein C5E16_08370 [Clavibacter michiganensis]
MTSSDARNGGLGRQATFLAGATGIAQIGTAIIYLIAARSSGPEAFGQAVTAVAVATAAVGIIDFGTNSLWLRETARGDLTPITLLQRSYGKLLIACLVLAAAATAIVVLAPDTNLWTAAPIGMFLLLSQTAQVPIRARARMSVIAASLLIDRATGLAVMGTALAIDIRGATILWIALVSGSIVSTAFLVFKMPDREAFRSARTIDLHPWSGSGFYGLSSVAVSAQSLDVAILSATAGPSAAGLYGAVNRWTQPMSLAVTAFAQSAVPVVARYRSWALAWPHVRNALWMPAAAMTACVIAFVTAPAVVDFLVGAAYAQSADVLRILAIGTLFAIINQPLAVFQQSLGRDRPVSFATVSSVALQLILVAVLAPQYGAMGAAWAFVAAQICICALLLVTLFRSHRPHL